MALTRQQAYITWSSANYLTVSAATMQLSDAYAFDATDVAATIQVEADNQSTAASGDTCDVYLLGSVGDVGSGSGSDTFDTTEYALFLYRLDTYAANSPGEDPARKTLFDVPIAGLKAIKIGVICAQAATRNIKVSVRIGTQRAA